MYKSKLEAETSSVSPKPRLHKTAVSCCFFIIGYQYFRKHFGNIFEKVCKFKIRLYICIVKQLKQSKMTTAEKKQAILNVIYERAYELVEKAEEYRGILFPENANHNEIENAALKKAFEEWKENKPVFNKPAFL